MRSTARQAHGSNRVPHLTFVDADSPKAVVRIYAGLKDADYFLLMELQSAFRKYEIQCTAVSINFNKDDEAYLASNEQCPLFKKNDKDAELKLKEALYYYTPSK